MSCDAAGLNVLVVHSLHPISPSSITPYPSRIYFYHLSLALPTFICMSTNPKDARAKGRAVGQAIVSLFDKLSIRDEAATYIAVAELDRLLPDSSTDISGVIEAINSVPYLLEFILCGKSPIF